MKEREKLLYEVPSFQVFQTQAEGVICQSPNIIPERTDYIIIDDNPFTV